MNCEFTTKKGEPCKGRPMPGLHEGKRACRAHRPHDREPAAAPSAAPPSGGGTGAFMCGVPGCRHKALFFIRGFRFCARCNIAVQFFQSLPTHAPPPRPPPPKAPRRAAPPATTPDYVILGLASPYVTKAQVRQAFLRKAKEWHPDRNSSEEAKQKFQEVKAAYDRMMGVH